MTNHQSSHDLFDLEPLLARAVQTVRAEALPDDVVAQVINRARRLDATLPSGSAAANEPQTPVRGFERMPGPRGPSARATIDLLRERPPATVNAADRPAIVPVAWKRIFDQGREVMRRPVSRLIAAAAACLAIFSVWSLFPGEHSTAHALNAFAEAIVEARTATFESNTKIEGMAEHKAQCCYLASGKMRTESKSSALDQLQGIPEEARAALKVEEIQFVMIQDWKTGDSLTLSSTQKKATITHQLNRPSAQQAGGLAFFEEMRDLLSNAKNATEAEFKPLGEKEIDGRRVLGFRRSSPELSTTLWGDPKTRLPVLVEMKSTNPEMESTMSHFKFNVDLKPELFDMTPPEDYTVNTVDVDFSKPTEVSLMTMFRLQTGLSDGVFFDNLDWDGQGERFANRPTCSAKAVPKT